MSTTVLNAADRLIDIYYIKTMTRQIHLELADTIVLHQSERFPMGLLVSDIFHEHLVAARCFVDPEHSLVTLKLYLLIWEWLCL